MKTISFVSVKIRELWRQICLLPGLNLVFIIFYQYFVVYTSFDTESLFRFDAWFASISVSDSFFNLYCKIWETNETYGRKLFVPPSQLRPLFKTSWSSFLCPKLLFFPGRPKLLCSHGCYCKHAFQAESSTGILCPPIKCSQ